MNKITKKVKKSQASMTTKKKKILNDVRARYAYEILKRLADEDAKISKRIDDLALEYLIEVNPDQIAESVFSDLDHLAVEEVWDNSGGTRDGYVDPNELASEMFEEALEPYIDELRKCQEMSMAEEAKLHCMGILKGIYKFEKKPQQNSRTGLWMIFMKISNTFLMSGKKGTRIRRIWKRWMSLLRTIVVSGIMTLKKVNNIS